MSPVAAFKEFCSPLLLLLVFPEKYTGIETLTILSVNFGCDKIWEADRLCLSAPLQGPEVVVARNSSSTSMVLRWSHLPENIFRGQPIGCSITYHPVNLESSFSVLSVNYPTNTTTLTNLTVYTTYVINVSAVSSGGIGPASTAKARTDAEGEISWKCPKLLKQH